MPVSQPFVCHHCWDTQKKNWNDSCEHAKEVFENGKKFERERLKGETELCPTCGVHKDELHRLRSKVQEQRVHLDTSREKSERAEAAQVRMYRAALDQEGLSKEERRKLKNIMFAAAYGKGLVPKTLEQTPASDPTKKRRKFSIFFAWYDFWVGWYYDREDRSLYICPLPMLVLRIQLKK